MDRRRMDRNGAQPAAERRRRGVPAQLTLLAAVALAAAFALQPGSVPLRVIAIDYPADGSVFPPEITPPTFLWRDSEPDAEVWTIEIAFGNGASGMRVTAAGERFRIGEIDPRCVSDTNRPPAPAPEQAAARTWTPDPETWAAIKRQSVESPAGVTITGFRKDNPGQPVSRGGMTFQTSKDPVGAPIFYRDVPLMPSQTEKGVIKPLSASAVPLVSWHLRNVGEPRSHLVMEGLHSCANCHSFSADGKTLGMDLDGPRSDKGMYAIVPVAPRMTIRNEDVITWSSFQGNGAGQARIGFMSQVSPDGRYVVTTLSGPEALRPASRGQARNAPQSNFYVANFKDYRFLQVFYPTRGILAWYDRQTGRLRALPGADDPGYVQASAVWSPDGKYLVFARAQAKEPYPGGDSAEYANDLRETQIQYDLYRIPFNGGAGGRAERIVGASGNGMSNSFPKVSPDGRWIVFVQSRNGQLMRPDGRLYIVPAEGGEARLMRCNTPLMNSWHSFSPNGRWLVFTSKSRSPYTQMFLTHIDEHGNDSPPILIDNATAANRAVNIPEFVNISPEQPMRIEAPAAEFYRLFDIAWELGSKGGGEAAVSAWRKALALSPSDARAHYNLGVTLAGIGKFDEAIIHYRKALEEQPEFGEVHNNLAVALAATGKLDEAVTHYGQALEFYPNAPDIRTNFGVALIWKGRPEEAIAQFERALQLDPGFVEARRNLGDALYYFRGRLGEALAEWRAVLRAMPDDIAVLNEAAWVLATATDSTIRNGSEAVQLAERAERLAGGREPAVLNTLAAAYAESGRFRECVETARRALALARRQGNRPLADSIKARLALYETNTPAREKRPSSPLPALPR